MDAQRKRTTSQKAHFIAVSVSFFTVRNKGSVSFEVVLFV